MIPPSWPAWAEQQRHRVLALFWTVLVLGLLAFLVRGADRPADPHVEANRRPLEGFEEIAVQVTTATGEVLGWCALLAASEAARQQGLMAQADLRGYEAMIFRFDAPVTNRFYMFHTVLPLSIAWFDEAGGFVGAADMDPCPSEEASTCPTFGAPVPYLHAVETTRGALELLAIRPGSRLSFPGGECA